VIRIFQPTLGQAELDALAEVFRDQWPGAGPRVKSFEKAFAAYVGVGSEQTLAITSCTEGLFQSVAALGLHSQDEVIVPTISFIGAPHAVRAAGATLQLVDVDRLTLNPRVDQLEKVISPRTKAILLLHFGGQLEEIPVIAELAKTRGIVLIEDAACALGGSCEGRAYGTFGDIGVWSFDSMKLLVTGDGGMMYVRDEILRRQIFNRVSLGGVRPGFNEAARKQARWWEIDPECWGRLSFMNDLVASIGLVQLTRIDNFIRRRREIVQRYDEAFGTIPWINLPPSSAESVPYFYWIQTPPEVRDPLAYYLRESGIYTTFRYWPIHRTQLYADTGQYPEADRASETILLLPVHQNLSDSDIERVVEAVTRFKAPVRY
jgi:aminotransferase